MPPFGKQARDARSFGEFFKLPERQGACPCPHSHHTSSSPSGNNSEPCCPNERWSTLWAVTARAYPTGWFSRSFFQILVFGCAYRRIADESCSATTLRDRRDEWTACGVIETLREIVLEAYDRFIGLELADVAVDGCITKAPCGGEKAGKSPVDRGSRQSSAPRRWTLAVSP